MDEYIEGRGLCELQRRHLSWELRLLKGSWLLKGASKDPLRDSSARVHPVRISGCEFQGSVRDLDGFRVRI